MKLIQSNKLRQLVKLWAEYNELDNEWQIRITRGDWDHGGFCIYDGVIEFYEYNSRMSLTVFVQGEENNIESEKFYKLKELISE